MGIVLALGDTLMMYHPRLQFGFLGPCFLGQILFILFQRPMRRGWENVTMTMVALSNLCAVFVVFCAKTDLFSDVGIVIAIIVLLVLSFVVAFFLVYDPLVLAPKREA